MELKHHSRFHYWIIALVTMVILFLGVWWLYLIFTLSKSLSTLTSSGLIDEKFFHMIKWEGSTFFVLLMVLSSYLMYFYWQNLKKTKNLSDFFASLTHELKTPLTSIRLQTDVLKEILIDQSDEQVKTYLNRLSHDTIKLENEIDKTLHLSRIHKGIALPLQEVPLKKFLEKFVQEYPELQIQIENSSTTQYVLADEHGLKVIFRNLFDNTLKHSPDSKKVLLKIADFGEKIEVIYDDFGRTFTGELGKLGTPFYKHSSGKGSGIGLYLVKSLTESMSGSFKIEHQSHLLFHLCFKQVNA